METKQGRNLGDTSRHITNTYSWEEENTTTNTVLKIMLNKKWKRRIIDTEHINEQAITLKIVVNRQRIKLMSVYFSHSGYADQNVEHFTERSRSTRQIAKKTYRLLEEISMQNWAYKCWQPDTLNERNKKVIGRNIGWCCKATQHSTRCTERHLGNKQLADLQHETRSKSTTY